MTIKGRLVMDNIYKVIEKGVKKYSRSRDIEYTIDEKGCHICVSHSPESDGYFSIGRNGKRMKMHRYIYEINNSDIPSELVVRHTCDNKSCINPEHLILGTQLDNINDRVERNRSAKQKGELNGMSKINEEDVLKIFKDTRNNDEIAKDFNISKNHVSNIKNGRRWSHITGGDSK
jgi:hypothetical protein